MEQTIYLLYILSNMFSIFNMHSPLLLRTVQLCSVIGASGAVKLKPLQAECATVTEVSLGGTPSTATAEVALQSLPEPANLQKTKYNKTLIEADYFVRTHFILNKRRVLQCPILQLENSLTQSSIYQHVNCHTDPIGSAQFLWVEQSADPIRLATQIRHCC